MTLRGGLHAHHQLHELGALELDAFFVGHLGRLDDAGDVGGGGIEAAEAAGVGFLERLDGFGIGPGGLLARARQRLVEAIAGEFDRVGLQTVLAGELVDQPGVERLFCGDGIALGGHLQRQRDAGNARDALRAARAWQQAKLDLGGAKLRRGDGDAIVAAECDLAAAAERGAVDRSDHRLVGGLDHIDQGGQGGFLHRLAELGDVGAGEEGAAIAADHHRVDSIVGNAFLDRRLDPLPHRGAERVDRRVVRNDDEDVALAVGGDRAGHFSFSPLPGDGRGPVSKVLVGERRASLRQASQLGPGLRRGAACQVSAL